MHDALCVVRRVLESKTVVVGGGAVEAALSIYLENFATSLVSIITLILFLPVILLSFFFLFYFVSVSVLFISALYEPTERLVLSEVKYCGR